MSLSENKRMKDRKPKRELKKENRQSQESEPHWGKARIEGNCL